MSVEDGPPVKIGGIEVEALECSQAPGVQLNGLRCTIAEPVIRRDA
jgi:hypothetical protein